jgi:hypothetical protein
LPGGCASRLLKTSMFDHARGLALGDDFLNPVLPKRGCRMNTVC